MRAEYSAAAGGVILVARFAAGAVLNYAFGIALAWLMVPSEFGTVSAVQNVLLLAAGILIAGPPWALAMRVAQAHGDPEATEPEFRTALIANVAFGILLGTAFLVAQLSGHQLVPTHEVRLDVIVAVEMPLMALNSVLWAVAQGSRRFGGLGIMQSGEILIKCAVGIFLVTALHAGPGGIALSFLVGTAGSVLVGLRTGKGLIPGPGRLASLGFLADSTSAWFASASMTFLITADLLGLEVAGRAAGVTSAVLAGYQACGLLARAGYYVSDALVDSVFPYIAHSKSPREKHRWFTAAARWVPLLLIPIQAELIIAPGPVLHLLLPGHYAGAQMVLRVLAAGTLGALVADMLIKSLFAAGHRREIGWLMPVAAMVEVLGLVVLVPRYGAVGAAWSYLIAVYVAVALLVPVHLRAFQVRLPRVRRVASYVLGLAPTAVAFILASRTPAVLSWALIVTGFALFTIPARRIRLITDADVRFLQELRERLAGSLAGPRPPRDLPRGRDLPEPTGPRLYRDSPEHELAGLRFHPERPASRWRSSLASLLGEWRLAAFCASVAAFAMLYNIFGSPDVLYDEAGYTSAAQKVALHWQLTLDNEPLFVHPPLMFLLQAGWLRLIGEASAALPSVIDAARLLSASAGVADILLIASLVYLLCSSASPRQRRLVTGVTAVLASLDPVLVRYDRQDVIEPFALCVSLLTLHAAWRLRDRGTLAYVAVTGLLGGLALLTNEITVFLIIVPPIFALLERNRSHFRRCAAAFGVAIAFLLLFPLWAVELGLGGSFLNIQDFDLRRLVGLVQITGFNVPGVSLLGALENSVAQYSSSYIVLAAGFCALVWCWSRRNTQSGNFLTAWLTASYGVGVYIATVGTLNEQFFVYILPAAIVGTVLFGDAIIARRARLGANGRTRRPRAKTFRPSVAIGSACCAGLIGLSAVSWVTNYAGTSDGVLLVTKYIKARLPACAAVNASGDVEKYLYLAPKNNFAYFSVGPAALADGVHYFILSPNDAIEQYGDMSPTLESWIRANGRRVITFPSQVYKTVQLWYVPINPYSPVADVTDIFGGVFVNTTATDCGGYTVTNGPAGDFYSAYAALGGKGMLGDPLSRVTMSARSGQEQLFDAIVLAATPGAGAPPHALPIVARLASGAPAAYRRAGLPPVASAASAAQRRRWLTNPAIARAYLDGQKDDAASYKAAVRRYGKPLGRPAVLPGGEIGQAFADTVLEVPEKGGSVHAAAVIPTALAAGLLRVPAVARGTQPPPPLPNPSPEGPPQPTTVLPFAVSLAAALLAYGGVITTVARRQRRRQHTPAVEYQHEEVAV
ncbi:MAG: polysaccharide biosynthesis C-terminal domain-containing protein [Streptosporangiaceae bacterium]